MLLATPLRKDRISRRSSVTIRCSDATTSAEVSGEPSWKRTPGRRRKTQVRGSGVSHETASAGTGRIERSRVTRGS